MSVEKYCTEINTFKGSDRRMQNDSLIWVEALISTLFSLLNLKRDSQVAIRAMCPSLMLGD